MTEISKSQQYWSALGEAQTKWLINKEENALLLTSFDKITSDTQVDHDDIIKQREEIITEVLDLKLKKLENSKDIKDHEKLDEIMKNKNIIWSLMAPFQAALEKILKQEVVN